MRIAIALSLVLAGCGADPWQVPDYREEAASRASRGRDAEADGDVQRALALYASALDLDPEHAPARLGRGRIFERMGSLGEAEREFGLAVELGAPERKGAHLYERARYFQRIGRPDPAIRDFERALVCLRERPEPALRMDCLLHRALALRDAGRLDDARKAAREVLDSDPPSAARDKAEALLLDLDNRPGVPRR